MAEKRIFSDISGLLFFNKLALVFLCNFYVCDLVTGPITFGSANSKIKVGSSGTLKVASQMTIEGGTLEKASGGTISGDASGVLVKFVDGYYDINGSSSRVTSNYDIFSGNKQTLVGSQTINSNYNSTIESLEVSSTGNSIVGAPTFATSVTLADSSTELDFGISSQLNVDLTLNSGKVSLSQDLKVSDGKSFLGDGTVDLAGHTLAFGGTELTFSGNIDWLNASDITLNSRTTLSATWGFCGDSKLQGHGNVLDFDSGGEFYICDSTVLSLTDIHIKDLGTGSFIFTGTTSEIKCSNVTIELDANVTFTTGKITIDGPTTIITKDKVLTFDTDSLLTVDGVALWYDTLGFADPETGIVPTDSADSNLTLTNDGIILAVQSPRQSLETIDHGPAMIWLDTSTTMTYDFNLSDDHTLNFVSTSTLTGNGHRINMSNEKSTQIDVAASVAATFEDVLIDNLASEHINLGAGASVTFGSGTQVNILPGTTMNATWTFGANTVLCGKGGSMILGGSGQISSTDSTGLTIKDLIITDLSGTNIQPSSAANKIIFDNCQLVMSANFDYSTGFFEVKNKVDVSGPFTFGYKTTATSTVLANSELAISNNATFQYAPSSGTDQTLFAMTDSTSRLSFYDTTLDVNDDGIILTNGTLLIDGQVNFQSAGVTVADGIIFGNGTLANDLTVDVTPGSSLHLKSGILVYDNAES